MTETRVAYHDGTVYVGNRSGTIYAWTPPPMPCVGPVT
ncbi:PQQ-binding-like beta-propeller repeat protein [Kitasatospora sp. NPDC085879]